MVAIYCYWEREKVLKVPGALMRGNTVIKIIKVVHIQLKIMDGLFKVAFLEGEKFEGVGWIWL